MTRATREPNGGGRTTRGFDQRAIGEMMTDTVVAVRPDDTLREAAWLMQYRDCGALPVVDPDLRPIGFVTDRDIAMYLGPRALTSEEVLVRQMMSPNVVTCDIHDTASRCLELMARHQVRRLPVVNERGFLVGIISQADFARHADSHAGAGERRSVATTISAISEPRGREGR